MAKARTHGLVYWSRLPGTAAGEDEDHDNDKNAHYDDDDDGDQDISDDDDDDNDSWVKILIAMMTMINDRDI